MIVFLLLGLSISSLVGHPAPSTDLSDPLCSTLKTLGQSLQDAILQGSLCMDSELGTNCTTESLEVLKKCLDLDGAEVDIKCLEAEHMKLTEVDDKACFCGGFVKYSEMLTSVKGLLCSSHLRQSHDMQKETSVPDCNAAASIRDTMEKASNDLYCKDDIRSDNDCAGVTLEELISSGDDVRLECFCGRWHQLMSTAAIVEATACAKEEKTRLGKARIPRRIAFSVSVADKDTLWGDGPMGFVETLTNEGNGWKNPYFVVPGDGVYHFSWTVISPWGHDIRVYLTKTDSSTSTDEKKAMSYARAGVSMVSGSVVLVLKEGDKVYLYIADGTRGHEGMTSIPGDNSFSGYRISNNIIFY